jgi:hypothetical protein
MVYDIQNCGLQTSLQSVIVTRLDCPWKPVTISVERVGDELRVAKR